MINKVTALIVSFYRPEYLEVCLSSIRETYPDINIIVGDNGKGNDGKVEMCKKYNAEYLKLPFDSGICVGRNMIMDKIKTPYVLVGDDDFKYDDRAVVEKMVKFMETNKDYSIIGGRTIQDGTVRNYQGFIDVVEGERSIWTALELDSYQKDNASGLEYKVCDIIFNFFVGRVEDINKVKWDENIKVAYEHSSFFIDMKKVGYKTAFSPEPLVIHKPKIDIKNKEQYSLYKHYRMRRSDKNYFYKKYRLQYCIDMAGRRDTPDKDGFQDIAFCITMFERPENLKRLLFSIAKYYPLANIYIADQSHKFYSKWYRKIYGDLEEAGLKNKPIAYNIGYDAGLSFCRNFLVEKTKSKYVLILEEDFEFTEGTKINNFLKILDKEPKFGMVGGMVLESGIPIGFQHNWKLIGKVLKQIPDGDNYYDDGFLRYKATGSVMNFFLARRELLMTTKWDNRLKIEGEHSDFMLAVNDSDWEIAYTDQVSINHTKVKNDGWKLPDSKPFCYKKMRQRWDFLKILLEKHNLKKIIYIDGYTIKLENGTITKGKNI